MSHLLHLDDVWLSFPVVDLLTCLLMASLLLPQIMALRKKKTTENAVVALKT